MSAAVGTHTLVRIEAMTEEEIARQSWEVKKRLKLAPWRPPAPIKVPPPPDYSTPAKVTSRCLERGTGEGADIRAAGKDTEFKKLLREFRTTAAPVPCRVEDTHRSKWEIAGEYEGEGWRRRQVGWTLVERQSAAEVKPRRKRRAA